ncbi:MAG: carboxymuconolactone decarboxylase family protein [Desulfobacteraceae bacterium]|nr:carboxymuconolactone decarboxylase family protein [Desulfobacteraceae bacterium]
MTKLPKMYSDFLEGYPDMAAAYQSLGKAAGESGPLEEKERELIKLGIAVGAGSEGAVHSHVRRALEMGATNEEIRHAVLLSITTIGLPAMMAALTWAEDILKN